MPALAMQGQAGPGRRSPTRDRPSSAPDATRRGPPGSLAQLHALRGGRPAGAAVAARGAALRPRPAGDAQHDRAAAVRREIRREPAIQPGGNLSISRPSEGARPVHFRHHRYRLPARLRCRRGRPPSSSPPSTTTTLEAMLVPAGTPTAIRRSISGRDHGSPGPTAYPRPARHRAVRRGPTCAWKHWTRWSPATATSCATRPGDFRRPYAPALRADTLLNSVRPGQEARPGGR